MGERVVCVWRTVGAGCAVQARRQRLTVSPSQNPSRESDGSRQICLQSLAKKTRLALSARFEI